MGASSLLPGTLRLTWTIATASKPLFSDFILVTPNSFSAVIRVIIVDTQ